MELKAQVKLVKAFDVTTEAGWNAVNILRDHGVISMEVYVWARNHRVATHLSKQAAYHWHPVIQESRMAIAEVSN